MTTAVLLATAPGEGGAAALLPWDGGTILERTLAQVTRLGVGEVHVVARPAWAGALDGLPVDVHVSGGPADDLRLIAELAAGGRGDLLLAHADVVAHDRAVAAVLGDGTAALVGHAGVFAPAVRERGGRVVSAASAYHSVERPTGAFLGVLLVAEQDRAAIAELAARLGAELPPAWRAELERKAAGWREATGDAEARRHVAAAREDIASLLLTAMVRDGLRVAAAPLRRLLWARPLARVAAAEAAERLARSDEDRLALDSAVKARDALFTTLLVSPYSRFIARWAARRGITPNQVTIASLVLGLLAAAGFGTGERWGLIAGAVLVQVSFTTDCVDGQLARYTRSFSALGGWLDGMFDRLKEYAIFGGLAIGASRAGDPVWVLAACALTLHTARHLIYLAYRDAKVPAPDPPQPPLAQPSDRVGPPEPVPTPPRSTARALAVWQRLGRRRPVDWASRLIALPIGERFAVISLTAALWNARTTFVVLLVWGCVAAVYTLGGRVLRSLADRRAATATRIAGYRDDGPLARVLGASLARALPLDEASLAVLAAAPLVAAVGADGDGASTPLAIAVVAWTALCGGASSGARAGRLGWTAVPLLRAAEYGALLWLAALAGRSALPPAFAVLAVLTFHHYDLVYRARLRGSEPARWIGTLALGWDGRLLVACLLLAVGAVRAGFAVAAVVLAVAFVAEAVHAWSGSAVPAPLSAAEEVDEEVEEA